MRNLLCILCCLLSLSALGQVNSGNAMLNNIEGSKTSFQFELSLPVVISQQSLIVEHRVFLNKKGNLRGNLKAGFGYLKIDYFGISEGPSGFLACSFLVGKVHCLEATLGLLVYNDLNSSDLEFSSSGDILPKFQLGYRCVSHDGLVFRSGFGTTNFYIGCGIMLN